MNQTVQKYTITSAEWEVMRVIWAFKEATSQQIIHVLGEKYQWKPATIKTLLGRLVKKESLTTSKSGNKFIYSPNVTETEVLTQAADQFLTHVCAKKVGQVMVDLLDKGTFSHEDIGLLEKKIAEKKAEAVAEISCNCLPGQCACTL